MAVNSVAVSTLSSYVAGLNIAAKAKVAPSSQSGGAQSTAQDAAQNAVQSASQASLASSRLALPAAPTAVQLAAETTFELERLAARGNMQAQRILDRREGLRGLSARPGNEFELSSLPERNVPQSRSTVTGTRVNTLA